MIAITWLTYMSYIFFIFYYVARIFGKPNIKMPVLLLLAFINSFFVYLPVYFLDFKYEMAMLVLYFLFFATEITFCYNLPVISTLAATLCFSINYFGVKTLFIGILSYNSNLQITEFLADINNRMLVLTLSFALLSGYITISSQILIHKVVKYLFADIKSLKLCCVLLGAVLIHQGFSLPTLYVNVPEPNFNSIYQIRTSLVSLVCFVIIMVAVFIYSRLRQASITYTDTSVEIQTDNIAIHKLEKEVITDFFTGFFIRSIAIEKLNNLLITKQYCYVLFIDLDGLKYVNDNFGHEEGDIYIKTSANFIKDIFADDTISRIGGDEFLIIGNSKTPKVKDKVQKCYDSVLNIQKDYATSISYGFVEVDENNTLSHDELIERADKQMYAFKKARQKERKSRKI